MSAKILSMANANKRLRGEMIEQAEREEIRDLYLYGEWRQQVSWDQADKRPWKLRAAITFGLILWFWYEVSELLLRWAR